MKIVDVRFQDLGLNSLMMLPRLPSDSRYNFIFAKPKQIASQQKDETCYERKKEHSVVYFIRAKSRVKIGFSKCVDKRMKALQTSSADELELVLTIPGGSSLERKLHEEFDEYRLYGEWFRWSKEIASFVKSTKKEQRNPGLF